MALNLGELAGIISLDEKPAMSALGRVRRGMQDTANEGQKSTDKLQAQQARYTASVENASAAVSRSRAREKDAADGVRLAEIRLADAKKKGVDGSARVVAAEKAVRSAHDRVRASQDATARSTRDLELSQTRLANSFQKDNKRISVDFHQMAQTLSWDGTRTGRLVARSFAMMAVGATAVLPAVGALGSGVIAASGSVLTLAGSIKQLAGVAALAPAGLFALGSGAGVLMSAFSGMGEALKAANEQTTATAGSAKLDAMTLADAARAVALAERTSSEQRAASLRRVTDAQEQAAEQNLAAAERVTEAEQRAAEARATALRRVSDAQRDVARVVEQNAEQQASALTRVEDATEGVENANKRVLESEMDLSRARKEAAAQLLDLQSSLESASLSERAAVLNFQEAERALRRGIEAGVSGTTREMQERQLAFDQADFALREARKRTQSLREEEAAAAKAGVAGSDRVLDAQENLRESREASLKALEDQKKATVEADKVQRDNAERLADAKRGEAEARRDVTAAELDGAKDVADARKALARTERDSARSVADAIEDASRSQRDSVEAVEDAYRSLERTQIQQAEAAIKLTEKSVDAMGKLTPAAQAMAAALLIAYGRLGDVRDIAQENFFAGMDAPLLALVDTVIPQLERGVGGLAAAYGAGARTIIRALDRELGNGVLERMFDRSTEAAYILNDAIDPVVSALVTLTDVGMEYMPRLAGGIRDAAGEFDAFIQQAADDGSLRGWIDDGIEGTKDLFSIFGSVLGILDKLEDAARAGGIATTLGSVADGLDRIEDRVSGPVFQSTMATIFAGARGGAEGLLAALGPIGEAFRVGGPALAEFLRLGGEIAGTFVGSMFTGLSDPNFGSGLTDFLGHVQDGVDDLGPLLPGLFSALGDVLESVGPAVEAFGPTAVEVLTIFAEGLAGILDFMEPMLTALAGSPVAVGIFMGVIGSTALLGTMATFAGNLQGIATGFKAIWIAATGPLGLAIIGTIGLFSAAAVAADWFFTETDLGKDIIRNSAWIMLNAWKGFADFVVTKAAPSLSAAQTVVMTSTTKLGAWWVGKFLGMRDATSQYTADMSSDVLGLKKDVDTYMTAMGVVLGKVPGYFDAAKTGAMLAWDALKEEAKVPVRFVVDTVIGSLVETFWALPGIDEKNLPKPKLPKGFRHGGYTGNGGVDEAAGIVHGKEFVFTAAQTAAIGKDNLAAQASAAVRGKPEGAATRGEGNMGGFFEGNAAAIRPHGAYYMSVAQGMGGWDFPGAARLWDGAAGLKVKIGTGKHQGHVYPRERGGGILGYTTGTNIDMSPTWMNQLGPTQRRTVAAHEMGHAMGLPHNSLNSIMQPNLGNMAAVPTALDIRNLQALFPGGSGKAGTGGPVVNPFGGIVKTLMSSFTKQFPGGGMFVDAVGGVATSGIGEVVKWVQSIKDTATSVGGLGLDIAKDKVGDIAGDIAGNLRDFFGGAAMAPTLMDGGGWLRDTDGPQLVDHRRKKPDAFTPYDEWQQIKRDYANAQGPVVNSTIQYVGENPEQFADRERRRMQDALDAYA